MEQYKAIKREPCHKCGDRVFLAERVSVGEYFFHRRCFNCARCQTPMSASDSYETESGEFCCNVCPDEEKERDAVPVVGVSVADKVALIERVGVQLSARPLSDEEKRTSLQRLTNMTMNADERQEEEEEDIDEEVEESDSDESDIEASFHELINEVEQRDAKIATTATTEFPDLAAFDRATLECMMREEIEKILSKALDSIAVAVEEEKPKPVPRTKRQKPVEIMMKPELPPKPVSKPPIKPRPAVAKKESYPSDLNPFGDDDEEVVNTSKNPFDSEDDTPKKESTNPFGSDDEDDDDDVMIRSSGGNSSRSSRRTPVPTPRKLGSSNSDRNTLSPGFEFHGSSLSLASDGTGTTPRKKKRAPAPPSILLQTSLSNSRAENLDYESESSTSSKTPSRTLKRRAPPPPPPPAPAATSTPTRKVIELTEELLNSSTPESVQPPASTYRMEIRPLSLNLSLDEEPHNKSEKGKWKRRKRIAPAAPMQIRASIKAMSPDDIKRELDDIDIKQLGLEQQGVKLEERIREKCEGKGVKASDVNPKEVEDMIMQLFDVVNEKNDLFRRQAELMYMRRLHRLEMEQIELDAEIRRLMAQPDKTDAEKKREESLIARLLEVVTQRNQVIDSLELERIREKQEDTSIRQSIEKHAAKFEKLAQKAQSKFGKAKDKKKSPKKVKDGGEDGSGEKQKKKKKNVFNRLIANAKTKP